MTNHSICLTIAGSDPSGGAGIQADLKTFFRFRCYGMAVITALTAQNTLGVSGVFDVTPDFVLNQLESVYEDVPPLYVKTGMLASAEIVSVVAEFFKDTKHTVNLTIDPVMVSTSGALLLEKSALQAYIEKLFPLASLVTPNNHEAGVITGKKILTLDDAIEAAQLIYKMGPKSVLVKGGDFQLDKDTTTDIFFDGKEIKHFTHRRVLTGSTHGTGCTLSAAICANLAHGKNLTEAIELSRMYVLNAILTAPEIGKGNGPTNHFAELPANI